MTKTVKIFDTTLRDGEQSPGCSMNLKEKIEMAQQLERMNVDIIEAGFAAASPEDLRSIQEISKHIKKCTVTSLARAHKDDIDKAWESLKYAANPRIHVFLATSPIHMEYKLKMSPEKVLETSEKMVSYAKSFCDNIEFSAEDATRSDADFLAQVFDAVIKAGATTINIPDTVGYTTPDEYYDFITTIINKCPALKTVDISVHCHNDLGLAVANSIAAIKAGATQIECTVNGIGERAGNAALEEIVMSLNTRKDYFGAETRIDTKQIVRSSSLLTRITGIKVQPNKAIVGANAFAHESGIHQHGVLNNKQTYEIMTPESIGLDTNKLVLGKHSGRHAFSDKLTKLGYTLTKDELDIAFKKFKDLADKKKIVYDRDIDALVSRQKVQIPKIFELVKFVINSGNAITSTATLSVRKGNDVIEEVAAGEGPIYASFKAIEKIIGKSLELADFSLNSVTEGEDALGDAVVKLKENGRVYVGRGLSTDIIEASIIAYINSLNKMVFENRTI
ncbi:MULTISPECIES: 2-isopropylmalate synthase [unclassified Sedimentibacter]|uniref:2-isopropylmalate synthase n=1 Tax=unclassified Sedimentibacter TaxID=2649220 RepID=UPI0027E1FF30|nr:2-isopropylmalate synthase [Sedimentibacter sp. MB35-C1]WMJ76502.1 2-isopropylmalate synthase [Sedimentibacter sp. MB35-C1]